MANTTTPMRAPWGDIAPALTRISDSVLFDNVWQRPGLSPRDRSLITVASLIALYRGNELPYHLTRALENGVTRDEIIEVVTHLVFYSGWPTASSALAVIRRVFDEADAHGRSGSLGPQGDADQQHQPRHPHHASGQ